ncbi:hypothetical protein PGT21_018858 [Puccinia graminis f. sp. tritici]|uniref:Uncharacterized protein n=1 Tax=Puccinia graminis f. sp. tritici TaxID=56615 RepID=A0A5B0P6V7_PUCGR|nr:hypothetical protein PGT21_018858 [Puccinia graminis f. sp. tritici]KAA1131923.1 hypothetical protein PGTUg99_033857 [Puccinia graminis f. sp. tritici]
MSSLSLKTIIHPDYVDNTLLENNLVKIKLTVISEPPLTDTTQRDGSKKSRPPCRRPGRKGDHMTHQGASGTRGCTGAPRPVRAALWVSMVALRRDRVDPQQARPGGD